MATRQTRGNTAARRPAKKAAPVVTRRTTKKDVTEYADKPATPYQKAFANWAVKEVGFDPDTAASKRAAFLRGLVIGVAARPAFNESEFLSEWRERTGETKRGPKPKTETEPTSNRRTRRTPEAVDPEDFEDEDSEDSEDEDFEDETDSEDSEDEDFEDEDSEDEDFEDDEEVEEAPKRPAKKAAPRKAAPASARTAQRSGTAKARKATKPTATEDDDYLF